MRNAFYGLALVAIAGLLGGCLVTVPAPRADEGTAPVDYRAVQALSIEVFNPGEAAIFAVSSVLVMGRDEALLIDAQFSSRQASQLIERVRASGRRLTTIYISHGDPDYYFGLETLHAAFPEARIVATPQTVAHINATWRDKLKVWGPELAGGAPKSIIIPEPLAGDTLMLEGQALNIIGLDGPAPERTAVWIPSLETIAGGIPVTAGEHVWMADTQSAESHARWLNLLEQIRQLQPTRIIPGHFSGAMPNGQQALTFTRDYIRAFDEETTRTANAAELIAAMKKRYPGLPGESGLELSAKVAKGEMQWP